jgi:FAD/FMN-containing dehydrogenase
MNDGHPIKSGTFLAPLNSNQEEVVGLVKRSEALDQSVIPASLVDSVIKPGDASYKRVKSTYFRGGAPGVIFQVKNKEQVVEAVAFARSHAHLPLGIRSGGHGISGRSTNNGGIVIDLSRLNKIEILDESTRRVRIEPGARWMDVAAALAPYGWGLSSGDYGGVGVGGLATAGGIGWLARSHGLTIDQLRAVEIVLADGSVVRASDQENPDLFWAVRGAGANFGIVTSFEFQAIDVENVGWAQLIFDASDTAGFLQKWGAILENSPRDLTSFLILNAPRSGQPTLAYVTAVVNSDDSQTIVNRLQPLAEIAPMVDQQVVITPYASIMTTAQGGDHNGQGDPVSRSGSLEHITPEFAAAAARLIQSGATYFFQIRSMGGTVSDVPVDATAFGSRSANFEVTAAGVDRERLSDAWDNLRPFFSGLYLNFDTDQRLERLLDAFPPKTLKRLRELKLRYDPENIFRDNFNIAPQLQKEAFSE